VNCDPLTATEIADYDRALEGIDTDAAKFARLRFKGAGEKALQSCLDEAAWKSSGADIVAEKAELERYYSDGRFAERISILQYGACNVKSPAGRAGVTLTAVIPFIDKIVLGAIGEGVDERSERQISEQTAAFAIAILYEKPCLKSEELRPDLKELADAAIASANTSSKTSASP
jgi:hypothetical protein